MRTLGSRHANALSLCGYNTSTQVQQELGCEEWNVEAHLNELLLCEEGCFYRQASTVLLLSLANLAQKKTVRIRS